MRPQCLKMAIDNLAKWDFIADCTAPFTVDIFFNDISDKGSVVGIANSKQSKGITLPELVNSVRKITYLFFSAFHPFRSVFGVLPSGLLIISVVWL